MGGYCFLRVKGILMNECHVISCTYIYMTQSTAWHQLNGVLLYRRKFSLVQVFFSHNIIDYRA